jgi:16S rRNA (cytosine967-C5)-methyltransferase
MTPGAHLSAAAEILNAIAIEQAPASDILKTWGRGNRFAGSKDRRAISDWVYAALRLYPQYHYLKGQWRLLVVMAALKHGRSMQDIEVMCTQPHGLGMLSPVEIQYINGTGDPYPFGKPDPLPLPEGKALDALFTRAPVDIRVNAARGEMDLLELPNFTPCPFATHGLRGPSGASVTATQAYQNGDLEVQDEAAQIAAALVGARPGETVIDYCAGGGGKTMALAADMHGQGRLIACDVDARRLEAIKPRAARAGVDVDYVLLPSTDLPLADRVIVDAPCTGSGVWRRRPEDAWRLTHDRIAELVNIQAEILVSAASLVKPGGRLVYVTCSVIDAENTHQADAFLHSHPNFKPVPIADAARTDALTPWAQSHLAQFAGGGHTLTLNPHTTQTDGFFVALLERK